MTSPQVIYQRASYLLDAISKSRTVQDLGEAIAGQNRLSQLSTKTARYCYWDHTDPDEVRIMKKRIISDALRSTSRARNEDLSRGELVVGKAEVNAFITHRLMISDVEDLRTELDGVDEREIRSRNSECAISKDLGRAILEALFTCAFRGNNSFISKVERSLGTRQESDFYDFLDTGISSLELRLDNADGKEANGGLIEGLRGELLTQRFVEELNLRFQKRRHTNSSRWGREPDRVLQKVRRALCLEHYSGLNKEGCREILVILKERKGNVSMIGPPAKTRGACCIKCLYPDMEKPVSKPLVYINALNEARKGSRSDSVDINDVVDINGVQKSDVDYCDRWSFGLLADLFSDDRESMEKAIYSNSEPRFYDVETLRVVQEFFSAADINPWATEMSPWVIFEVATAYGLDVNAHLQDLSDSVCSKISQGIDRNKEDLERGDRILGGLASCFSRECLRKLQRVHVAIMKNNLFGCLMVMDADAGYVPTLGDYIRFRWNLFLKKKQKGNIGAFGEELTKSGYEVRVRGNKLAFRKGPRIVEGQIVEQSISVWHFIRENPSSSDQESLLLGGGSESEGFEDASEGLVRAINDRVISENVLVEGRTTWR